MGIIEFIANIMSFNLFTPKEISQKLAQKAKELRLSLNLSQEGLAKRSGVTLASIKRFERTSEISLKNLCKIALVLNELDDFENLFIPKTKNLTIEDFLKEKPKRKRGKVK